MSNMSDLFTEAERLGIDTSAPDAIQQTQIALVIEDLSRAVEGSFYTICGAGGDLDEWIEGMTKMLIEAEIGAPKAWYKTTGAAVNAFAQPFRRTDWFPSDRAGCPGRSRSRRSPLGCIVVARCLASAALMARSACGSKRNTTSQGS